MNKSGPGFARTRVFAGALTVLLPMMQAGCGGEPEQKTSVPKTDPQMEKQVNDMTKFYESHPPGAPAK